MTDFQVWPYPSVNKSTFVFETYLPIHDMQLILSCFHMDRTGNEGNNGKSVSTKSVLPTLPPPNPSRISFPATKWLQDC